MECRASLGIFSGSVNAGQQFNLKVLPQIYVGIPSNILCGFVGILDKICYLLFVLFMMCIFIQGIQTLSAMIGKNPSAVGRATVVVSYYIAAEMLFIYFQKKKEDGADYTKNKSYHSSTLALWARDMPTINANKI